MTLNDFDELGDNLNMQIDQRKLQKLADDGIISLEDIASAPILSVSECCGVDMIAEYPDGDATCEKCGKPCEGAEE